MTSSAMSRDVEVAGSPSEAASSSSIISCSGVAGWIGRAAAALFAYGLCQHDCRTMAVLLYRAGDILFVS